LYSVRSRAFTEGEEGGFWGEGKMVKRQESQGRTEWRTALRTAWRAELKKPRHRHPGLPPATRNERMTESMADDG
jgi:hypothetical protein